MSEKALITQVTESGLMNVKETSEFWHVKTSTVRSWILDRRIQYVKLMGRVFVRKVDAEALIQRSIVPAADSEVELAVASGGTQGVGNE